MKLILSHINCDFDAFASMLAAQLIYPEFKIMIVGSAEVHLREFLNNFQGRFSFVSEKNIELDEIKELIIVDNKDINRMGKIGNWIQSEKPKIPITCFDHHPDDKSDLDFTYLLEERTGACITILLDLINEQGIRINGLLASIFAMGIYEDTGNFMYKNVTAKDFAAVSYLFENGADIKRINRYLGNEFSPEQIRQMNVMLNNINTITVRGIEINFIRLDNENANHDLAYLLSFVKKSKDIKLIFCLSKENSKISIIGRNDLEIVNLSHILHEFGGGGHRSAGSANIENQSFVAIENKIIKLVEEQIADFGLARDIMSAPVDMISPETTIKEAQQIIISKGYGQISVGKSNKLMGVITKKDIMKALHHDFHKEIVENFMYTYNYILPETISIRRVQEIVVENSLDFVFIGNKEKKKVYGIITQQDIVKAQLHHSLSSKFRLEHKFQNVAGLIQKSLPKKYIELLRRAGKVADSLKYSAYVVGGVARDIILNRYIDDIDIVIDGNGIEFGKEFTKQYGKKAVYHRKYKTAVVTMPDNSKLDIVTARTEYYKKPGDSPIVEMASLRNDLQRRDFTINTLVINLNPQSFGDLVDHYQGRRDINLGIIKILHNLSFIEDPIRILRAVRFEQRFDFKMEANTQHLLRKSIEMNSLKNDAKARVRDEFVSSGYEEKPEKIFKRMDELGVLEQLYSFLNFDKRKYEIFDSLRKTFIKEKENLDLGKFEKWIPSILILLSDLRLRKKIKFLSTYLFKDRIIKISRDIEDFFENKYEEINSTQVKNTSIYNAFKFYNEETLIYISSAYPELSQQVHLFLKNLRNIKLQVNGNDLKQLGYNEGKIIGKGLKHLLSMKLEGLIENRHQEIKEAKEFLENL